MPGRAEHPHHAVGVDAVHRLNAFASAYLFGAVCPSAGKAAALIMPICNTAAMNHHLCEISSQVAADAHAAPFIEKRGHRRKPLSDRFDIDQL
jgi:hypothetical protein